MLGAEEAQDRGGSGQRKLRAEDALPFTAPSTTALLRWVEGAWFCLQLLEMLHPVNSGLSKTL